MSSADVTLGPTQAQLAASTFSRAAFGEVAGAQIGNYKLRQQLGEGGFGTVWMAEQEEPVRRSVAVKIIKLGMDTREVIARFEAERQALALMDHPHIARVLDAGATEAGRPFFVMELVKGDPITQYCDRNNLKVAERLELFIQVCHAVQHAHTKGVIHRDLKPSNVLVSTQDGKPHAKVIDFGIAKATASRLTEKTLFTQQSQLVGTPEYMSPEQAEGSLDIDTRTDVYSLGVMLYELLTGSTPFEGRTLRTAAYAEIQRIIREVEPPKPSTRISTSQTQQELAARRHVDVKELKSLLRGELDWIAMKALEKDRQRRYETANGMAMDVRRYLTGEAVLAAPPSTVYKMRKFVRRHKHAVAGAAFVAIALVLGVIGTSFGLVEARQQARAARSARDVAERRLAQLEAGTGLLMGIFADLDLQRVKAAGLSLEAELGERLAAAADQLEGESMGDPMAVASLQERLGLSLNRLGHSAKAASLLEKSVATRSERLGADHVDTLASMHHLAASYNSLGRLEDAVKLGEEVVERRKRVLGETDVDTLRSMSNLALAYSNAGRREDALKQFEQVLEKRRALLGLENLDTLASMTSVASSYLALNRLPEALTQLEEAGGLLKLRLGEDHPWTLMNMADTASTYRKMGRYEDAVDLYTTTLALQRGRLGADHPNTLQTMHNLAEAMGFLQRHADARKLYEDTLALQKVKLGNDHPDTLATMGSLAVNYSTLGEYDKAARLQEETLSLQRTKLPPDHPDVLTSMLNLATTYQSQGKNSDALRLREETVQRMTAAWGAQDPNTLVSKNNLADSYSLLGRHDEALTTRLEAAAGLKEHLGPDHLFSLVSAGNVASSYYDLGRTQEALETRQQVLAAMVNAGLSPDNSWTVKGRYALAQIMVALGRHEDAATSARETLELRAATLGGAHPETLASSLLLASCLMKLERTEEAAKVLQDSLLAVAGKEADPAIRRPVLLLRVLDSQLRGDAQAGRDAFDTLAALPKTDFRLLYDLAGSAARVASIHESEAGSGGVTAAAAGDQTIELLRQAIAAGFRNGPLLANDPSFDGIRGQEEFQNLLGGLAASDTAESR